MVVESFTLWSADTVVNQLHTGLAYISNPFQIKEPTKDFQCGAINQVVSYFKNTYVEVGVFVKDGFTIITANMN